MLILNTDLNYEVITYLKIIEITNLEYCLNGPYIKELTFDTNITDDFIYYLGELGELEYYQHFVKPFYTIEYPLKFILKGIQGKNKAKIILCRKDIDYHLENFKKLVDKYNFKMEEERLSWAKN